MSRKRFKINEELPIEVVKQGAIRVNCAQITADFGPAILLTVDLHSKYAMLSEAWIDYDQGGQWLYAEFKAGKETMHKCTGKKGKTLVRARIPDGFGFWGGADLIRYTMYATLFTYAEDDWVGAGLTDPINTPSSDGTS